MPGVAAIPALDAAHSRPADAARPRNILLTPIGVRPPGLDHCCPAFIRQSMIPALRLPAGRQFDPCPVRHAPDRRIAPCAAAFARNRRRIRLRFQGYRDCRFFLISDLGIPPHPDLLNMTSNIVK
jgi:hypothetical protein